MSVRRPCGATLRWVYACRRGDIIANAGAAVLVGGRQVALFRLCDPHSGAEQVHALDNIDPFSGAAVLARGLVGDAGGQPYVASPMYKQRFALRDGRCLDDPAVAVRVHAVRLVDDWILVGRQVGDGEGCVARGTCVAGGTCAAGAGPGAASIAAGGPRA
jgi:nitrite reductase (NADH) small subunit